MNLLVLFAFFLTAVADQSKDCVEHALSKICRKIADPSDRIRKWEKPCLGGEERFRPRFRLALEKVPAVVKPILCELEFITIESGLNSRAYAAKSYKKTRSDEKYDYYETNGFAIGFSEEMLNEEIYESEIETRKELLNFGLRFEDQIPDGFPKFTVGRTDEDWLYSTLIHEIGHLIDYANQVVKQDYRMCPISTNCTPGYHGIFSLISFEPTGKIRIGSDFEDSDKLCYYDCQDEPGRRLLELNEANRFYFYLMRTSGFVTPYASVNPTEDFAETFLQYVERTYGDPNIARFEIEVGFRGIVSISEKITKNIFVSAKWQYLEMLFKKGLKFSPIVETVKLPR